MPAQSTTFVVVVCGVFNKAQQSNQQSTIIITIFYHYTLHHKMPILFPIILAHTFMLISTTDNIILHDSIKPICCGCHSTKCALCVGFVPSLTTFCHTSYIQLAYPKEIKVTLSTDEHSLNSDIQIKDNYFIDSIILIIQVLNIFNCFQLH